MKIKGSKVCFYLSVVSIILSYSCIHSQTVCSLDELYRELLEDLDDNGRLDCLRESQPTSEETALQKQKRIKANWDSNCSFEIEEDESNDWRKTFLSQYQLKTFTDAYGNPNQPAYADFSDQADMCEIVRAMVANGAFSFGSNMDNIPLALLSNIDCYGSNSQTQICAANTGSFSDNKSWVIFINGDVLSINGKNKYQLEMNDNYKPSA